MPDRGIFTFQFQSALRELYVYLLAAVVASENFNPRSARGATFRHMHFEKHPVISIHAPREGSDPTGHLIDKAGVNFNPRSREGSDCVCECGKHTVVNFNPRSREGSDWFPFSRTHISKEISIHAPARGATQSYIRS